MQNKVWFITGCSTGLGKAFAEVALNAGNQVIVTARNIDSIKHFSDKYPNLATCFALDVQNQNQLNQVIEQIKSQFEQVDVLINNAGYGLQGAIEELSLEKIQKQFDTNVFGLIAVTQAILPMMRKKGGYIFNVSSIAGLRGFKGFGIYNASKFAVNGLSEALAQELEPFNIQVVCVEPGPYRTDWAGRSLQVSDEMKTGNPDSPYFGLNQHMSEWMEKSNGKQPGDPYQIAEIILQATEKQNLPLHMVFGDVAMKSWQEKLEKYQNSNYLRQFKYDERSF